MIHALMGWFSSAADFEINKLENSLVFILLKLEKILNGQTKVIKFHNNTWEINLSKDGSSKIIKSNDRQDITLNVEDISASLHGTFSFITNKKEVTKLKSNLARAEKELKTIKECYPKFKKQRVEKSRLEERDGITYIKGEDDPFSGYKIVYHLNSELVKSEIPYKDGEKTGVQIGYNNDGFLVGIINYKKGKEDGIVIRFHSPVELNKVYYAKKGEKHQGYVSFNRESQNI